MIENRLPVDMRAESPTPVSVIRQVADTESLLLNFLYKKLSVSVTDTESRQLSVIVDTVSRRLATGSRRLSVLVIRGVGNPESIY
jgi:hypothetical protein